MNNQPEFALPFLRGVAAKAADAAPSLPVSAANIIDDQTWTDTERGRALFGQCRPAPAHLGQGHVHSFVACRGFTASASGLVAANSPWRGFHTGPELRALGIFLGLRGCVNTRLAKPINSAEHSSYHAVQPFKRHSSVSLRYEPIRSDLGARKNGNPTQTRA